MKKLSFLTLLFSLNFLIINAQYVKQWGNILDESSNSVNLLLGSRNNNNYLNEILSENDYGIQLEYLYAISNGEILSDEITRSLGTKFQTYLQIKDLDYFAATYPVFHHRAIPPNEAPDGGTFNDSEEGNFFKIRFPYSEEIDYISNNRYILSGNLWSDGIQSSSKRRELWRDVFLSAIFQSEILSDEMNSENQVYEAALLTKFQKYNEQLKDINSGVSEIAEVLEFANSIYEIQKVGEIQSYINKLAGVSSNPWLSELLGAVKWVNAGVEIGASVNSGMFKILLLRALKNGECDQRLMMIENWLESFSPGYYDSEIVNGFSEAKDLYYQISHETYQAIADEIWLNSDFWISNFDAIIGPIANRAALKLAVAMKSSVAHGVFFVVTQIVDLGVELNNKYDLLRLASMAATLEDYLGSYIRNNYSHISNNIDEIEAKQTYLQINYFLGYYYYSMIKQVYDNKWYTKIDLLIELGTYFHDNDISDEQVLDYCDKGINRNIVKYNNYCQPYGFAKNEIDWFNTLIAGISSDQKVLLYNGTTSAYQAIVDHEISFSIDYMNLLSEAPSAIELNINGNSHVMVKNPLENDFLQGVSYNYSTVFTTSGTYSYYFEARTSDGGLYRWPETGSIDLNVSENSEGHDLSLYQLEIDDEWLRPGNDLHFDYYVRNIGMYPEDDFTIQYTLKDATGNIVAAGSDPGFTIPSGSWSTQMNASLQLDPLTEGFYAFEIWVLSGTDYSLGNNKAQVNIYIGNSNPYTTYLANSSDILMDIGTTESMQGYSIRLVTHDNNDQAIVNISKDGFSQSNVLLQMDELYFFDAFQFALVYLGPFGSDRGAFTSYVATSDISFAEEKITGEAEKTATYQALSNEEDPTPNIKFFPEGLLDGDIISSWNTEAYTLGTPYSNVYFDINIPSGAARTEYDFWVEMIADGRFIQKLKLEVIDPKPDFDINLQNTSFSLAPGMSVTADIDLEPRFSFDEKVVINFEDIPEGLSITLSDNNVSLPAEIDLQAEVTSDFTNYGFFRVKVSLTSATRMYEKFLYFNLVDASNNYIAITDIGYIDKDICKDSLRIKYEAFFTNAPTNTTTDWQYTLDGESWIDIPSNQIMNNDPKTEGIDSIIWRSNSVLYSQNPGFRLKSKSGDDFLEHLNMHYAGISQDFRGIFYRNGIFYLLDNDDGRVYTYTYSNGVLTNTGSFNTGVPDGIGDNMVYCYGYYYVMDASDELVYRLNSSWSRISTHTISEDRDNFLLVMNEKLYLQDDETDQFIEVNASLNPTGSPINCPVGRSEFAFYDGKNIWMGRAYNIYKVSSDYQTAESFTLDYVPRDITIQDGKLFATNRNERVHEYNFTDPYSFYSEYSNFQLNNTCSPLIDPLGPLMLNEDEPIPGAIDLSLLVTDGDTPFEQLECSILNSNQNIDIEINTITPNLVDITPKNNWFGIAQFTLQVKDNYNRAERIINYEVSSLNDAPLIKSATLNFLEDQSIIILMDTLVTDVDDEYDDLTVEITVSNDSLFWDYDPVSKTLDLHGMENFHGENFELNVSVEDALTANSTESIPINIFPVNDPVTEFNIVHPGDRLNYAYDTLTFIWNSSVDVEGDTVFYYLHILSEDMVLDSTVITTDTTAFFDFTPFISDKPASVEWVVMATDRKSFVSNNEGDLFFDMVESLPVSIPLTAGWNIFSLHVTPEDPTMMSILQPLMDEGSLVKIQDEEGGAIEYFAPLDMWINNIGDWRNTEGYKIRVNATTSLDVLGMPIELPLSIPLRGGWNIVSYPVGSTQDAMTALDELIVADNLVKVQNEEGAAIEYVASIDFWINNIHDFLPNEGYKVRVISDDDLTFNTPAKSFSYFENETGIANSEHFTKCWKGNGLDHMNIYFDPENSGLQKGDEIGIFDGELCVGSGTITNLNLDLLSMVVSADDPTTEAIDGFTEGNSLQLKIWNSKSGEKYVPAAIKFINGTKNHFEAMGTAVIELNSSPNNLDHLDTPITGLGMNYPNPFSQATTIPFTIGKETDVDIRIYDILGQEVTILVRETYKPGSYKVDWEISSTEPMPVMPGIYFVRLMANDQVFIQSLEVITH